MKVKIGSTRPAFDQLIDNPHAGPYRPGDIPAAWHTFHDFDIPRTYALISPVDEHKDYGMQFAIVYTPNPWARNQIRTYEWILHSDGIWRRSIGRTCDIETARLDYKKLKEQGRIPRDVIANPLNGSIYCDNPWDEWTCHFSGMTQQFYRVIPVYGNTYPLKAV